MLFLHVSFNPDARYAFKHWVDYLISRMLFNKPESDAALVKTKNLTDVRYDLHDYY